jgi:hypothetical protein
MARTERFRQQHNELLGIAQELQTLLDAQALAKDGSAARSCLGRLIGKLVVHLSIEDKVLYPALVSNKDPALAALANQFSTEMKSTITQVVAYNDRWPTPSAIKASPVVFAAETKQVISILTHRIKRENKELYMAADRTEGKAFE